MEIMQGVSDSLANIKRSFISTIKLNQPYSDELYYVQTASSEAVEPYQIDKNIGEKVL